MEEVDPENVRRMRKVLLLGVCLKTQITPLMIVAQRLGSPTRRWTTLEGEARKTLKPSWRQLTPPGCVSFYVCKYRKGKLPELMAIDLKIPIFDAQIDYWHETLPVRKGRAFADTRSAREEEYCRKERAGLNYLLTAGCRWTSRVLPCNTLRERSCPCASRTLQPACQGRLPRLCSSLPPGGPALHISLAIECCT